MPNNDDESVSTAGSDDNRGEETLSAAELQAQEDESAAADLIWKDPLYALPAADRLALVDQIQNAREKHIGIIINPGALTHYGWSIHDALASYEGIIIEVHLSNPNARETWRHTSVVAPVAHGSIIGFGGYGYQLSIKALDNIIESNGD